MWGDDDEASEEGGREGKAQLCFTHSLSQNGIGMLRIIRLHSRAVRTASVHLHSLRRNRAGDHALTLRHVFDAIDVSV